MGRALIALDRRYNNRFLPARTSPAPSPARAPAREPSPPMPTHARDGAPSPPTPSSVPTPSSLVRRSACWAFST